ncbi:hypothetical protein OC844_007258 [Tilletia horrida]|nr:hypothetical protein OC844_007258 [Tilletia horrida]
MKCSGDQPWCKTCRDRSQPCVYEPNAGKAQPAKRKFPASLCLTRPIELERGSSEDAVPSTASSQSSTSTLTSVSSMDAMDIERMPMTDSSVTSGMCIPSAPPQVPSSSTEPFVLQQVPGKKRGAPGTALSSATIKRKRGKSSAPAKNAAARREAAETANSTPQLPDNVGLYLDQLYQMFWAPTSVLHEHVSIQPASAQVDTAQTREGHRVGLQNLVEQMCAALSPLGSASCADALPAIAHFRKTLSDDHSTRPFDQPGHSANFPGPVPFREEHWFSQLLVDAFQTQPLLGLVVSKTLFLNDFGNRIEDKLLLNVVMGEALTTSTAEAAASLGFGKGLPPASCYYERAQAMLVERKCDSESAFITAQALVLLGFRSIEKGRIKCALSMFCLAHRAVAWILRDREEHPVTVILVNGIALGEIEDELLRNMYWLSRTASQWLLLHIGVPLSSSLFTEDTNKVSVIPTLPPLRPTESIVRKLDEVSGHFRPLRTHASSVTQLHILAHLSEVVSLLNAKLSPRTIDGSKRPLPTEKIAAELPHAILDTIISLDSIFKDTSPYSQLPHELRAVIVHLSLPDIRLAGESSDSGPVHLGISALNHVLRVVVTTLTEVTGRLQMSSSSGLSPEDVSSSALDVTALAEFGFPEGHLGRAAPAIVHLFSVSARAIEIVLHHSNLIPAPIVGEEIDHLCSKFSLGSESVSFIQERKGQVLYLLQQMHACLRNDALSCGSRRAVKKQVKQLVAGLKAGGVEPVVIGGIAAAGPPSVPAVFAAANDASPTRVKVDAAADPEALPPSAPVLPSSAPIATPLNSTSLAKTVSSLSDSNVKVKGRAPKSPASSRNIYSRTPRTPPRPVTLNPAPGPSTAQAYSPSTPPPMLHISPRKSAGGDGSFPLAAETPWSSPLGTNSLGLFNDHPVMPSSVVGAMPMSMSMSMSMSMYEREPPSTPGGLSSALASAPLFRTPAPLAHLPLAALHRPHTSVGTVTCTFGDHLGSSPASQELAAAGPSAAAASSPSVLMGSWPIGHSHLQRPQSSAGATGSSEEYSSQESQGFFSLSHPESHAEDLLGPFPGLSM